MALHTTELVSVVLATVAFFTVATCQVQFDAVEESDGLIDIELCLDASNLTDSNVTATNTTALRVYITSEGETASKLQKDSAYIEKLANNIHPIVVSYLPSRSEVAEVLA